MSEATHILLAVVLMPILFIGVLLCILALAVGILLLSPFLLILGIIELGEMAWELVKQLFNKPNKQ